MTKALIVDSDSNYLAKAQQALSWHGITVAAAENAQVALNMIWQETPDIVIAAVDLPQINGWTFCRLLKGSHRHAQLPFIFLAPEPDGAGAVKAFQLDADDYLPKSISFVELASRITKRAHKSAPIAGLPLQTNLLNGQLGRIRLTDVLQFLAIQGDAWAVTISSGSAVGQVLLAHGIVLQAVSSFLEGIPALQDLLAWEKGCFSIEPLTDISCFESINKPLEQILLELAANHDELARELNAREAAATAPQPAWPSAA